MSKWTMYCIASVICLVATLRAIDAAPLADTHGEHNIDDAAVVDSLCAQYPKLCAEIVARASAGMRVRVELVKQ